MLLAALDEMLVDLCWSFADMVCWQEAALHQIPFLQHVFLYLRFLLESRFFGDRECCSESSRAVEMAMIAVSYSAILLSS
jgi:hypothetical protein